MVDWDKLAEADIKLDAGEITKATAWALGLKDEDVEKIHAKFKAIADADDKKKALIDNSLFFIHIARSILLGV